MLIELARKFKYSKKPAWLQSAINIAYYNPDCPTIQKSNIDYVVMDNCKFYVTELMDSLVKHSSIPKWFDGIRPTDTVLDIGAGIGSCSIPWAKQAKKVYAVEPLFYRELLSNIELNKITNIKVIKEGLGNTGLIKFGSKVDVCRCVQLDYMLKYTGKVDFLKVDIEGAEFNTLFECEVKSIRELRIEWHIRNKVDYNKVSDWEALLKVDGYKVETWSGTHSWHPSFKDIVYMVASKENV